MATGAKAQSARANELSLKVAEPNQGRPDGGLLDLQVNQMNVMSNRVKHAISGISDTKSSNFALCT
jgi:hypothetical protein